MKLSNFLICLLLWAISASFVKAQSSQRQRFLRLTSLYVQTGVSHQKEFMMTLEDYRKLLPESELLKQDLNKFKRTSTERVSAHPLYSILLNFSLPTQTGLQLRMGFTRTGECTSYMSLVGSRYNSYYQPLPAPQDTTTTIFQNIEHYRKQMRFETSLTKKHNFLEYSRWNVEGGIGFSANLTWDGITELSKITLYDIKPTREAESPTNKMESKSEREKFTNAPQWGYAVFVPLAIEWQMKKNGRWFLVYEARPTLQISRVGKVKTFTHFQGQHNIGFRINLTNSK